MADELLTVAQAAKYLQFSTKTIYRMIHDGKLVASKINGHSWRIKTKDVEAVLQSRSMTDE